MAWNKIAPYQRLTADKLVSAWMSTASQRDNTVKLVLGLSKAALQQLPKVKRCDVEIGEGEHADMVRISLHADGAHTLHTMARGAGRVFLPPLDSCPAKPTRSAVCRAEWDGSDALVATLPLRAWAEDERQRTEKKPPAPAVAPKLDDGAYLRGRGLTVVPVSAEQLRIDGDLYQASGVLRVVNRERGKENLPPVLVADLRLEAA